MDSQTLLGVSEKAKDRYEHDLFRFIGDSDLEEIIISGELDGKMIFPSALGALFLTGKNMYGNKWAERVVSSLREKNRFIENISWPSHSH